MTVQTVRNVGTEVPQVAILEKLAIERPNITVEGKGDFKIEVGSGVDQGYIKLTLSNSKIEGLYAAEISVAQGVGGNSRGEVTAKIFPTAGEHHVANREALERALDTRMPNLIRILDRA